MSIKIIILATIVALVASKSTENDKENSHMSHEKNDHHLYIPHDYYAYPKYSFDYGVKDFKTGDYKMHREERDGDVVKGEYTVSDPDGTIRTVAYTVTKHGGFQAVVKKSGHEHHEYDIEIAHEHDTYKHGSEDAKKKSMEEFKIAEMKKSMVGTPVGYVNSEYKQSYVDNMKNKIEEKAVDNTMGKTVDSKLYEQVNEGYGHSYGGMIETMAKKDEMMKKSMNAYKYNEQLSKNEQKYQNININMGKQENIPMIPTPKEYIPQYNINNQNGDHSRASMHIDEKKLDNKMFVPMKQNMMNVGTEQKYYFTPYYQSSEY